MQSQDDAKQFLASVGITGLNDDKVEEASTTMLTVLNDRVGRRVISDLNEDQLKEFDQLTSEFELDDQKLSDFFAKNVPNYQQILAEEAQNLKEENESILGEPSDKEEQQ